MQELDNVRGTSSNSIIIDEVSESNLPTEILNRSTVIDTSEGTGISKEDIVKYSKKNSIHRNDKCPCGSGLKVKKCHTQYLDIRHYVVQNEINILNGLATVNRNANMCKGKRMTREQFIESLENKTKDDNKVNS